MCQMLIWVQHSKSSDICIWVFLHTTIKSCMTEVEQSEFNVSIFFRNSIIMSSLLSFPFSFSNMNLMMIKLLKIYIKSAIEQEDSQRIPAQAIHFHSINKTCMLDSNGHFHCIIINTFKSSIACKSICQVQIRMLQTGINVGPNYRSNVKYMFF